MKHKPVFLALTALVLASLACQTLLGSRGKDNTTPIDSGTNPTDVATQDGGSSTTSGQDSASGFPLTDDAFNVVDVGDGVVVYYTHLSLDEVMKFYRDEYVSQGLTERGLLTVVSDTTFSMVFDGDPSGKAIVIQGVDLGDGSSTVSIGLQDV